MNNSALSSRSWNGTPISRRSTDGYVNATAMCKANNKQWNDYWRTDRATEYLEALSTETGIPVSKLCLSMRGGSDQGTWVHPQVAVDLARWVSAPFAVWMDRWFLEEFQAQASQVRDTQPQSPALPGDVLTQVDRSITLLERLGGVDERAQMILRDVVLNATLVHAGGTVPLLTAQDLTLSEYLVELGCPAHRATRLATQLGRQVKRVYRATQGRDPKQQPQLVGGRRCQVAVYERPWLEGMRDELLVAIEEEAGPVT
jgi:hypothetical protein